MKLTFETMTVTLPEKDTEAAWNRLMLYMNVYFTNKRIAAEAEQEENA